MTNHVRICMHETIGGFMIFDLPKDTTPLNFETDIRDELAEEGIKELERRYDTTLEVTHRETDTCGVDAFEGERSDKPKSSEPTIAQYIATYINEEMGRTGRNATINNLDHFIANAVEAYEGGAR